MKRADVFNPTTWMRYRKGMCNNCTALCCTLPVRVDSEDLFQMGFITANEVNGSLTRVAAQLIRRGIIASFHRGNRTFVLKQKLNHDCVFLNESRRCIIYDRRPAVCRTFPKNSVRPGYCPKVAK